MENLNHLSLIAIVMFAAIPMFICGSLVRARGVIGLLVLTAAITVAVYLFTGLQDYRLAVGELAAIVGLMLGGKVSDARERQRLNRIGEAKRRERDAMMKGGVLNDRQ